MKVNGRVDESQPEEKRSRIRTFLRVTVAYQAHDSNRFEARE